MVEKEEIISTLQVKNTNLMEEMENLKESEISASNYAMLIDYSHTSERLNEFYTFHSPHEITHHWYVITEDNFEIELLNYEDAIQVEFYSLKTEASDGEVLLFADTLLVMDGSMKVAI